MIMCVFDHGIECLKLVIKFKMFDHFAEFLRERRTSNFGLV